MRTSRWSALAAGLGLLLAPTAARAQGFSPGSLLLQPVAPGGKVRRLNVGAYFSKWDSTPDSHVLTTRMFAEEFKNFVRPFEAIFPGTSLKAPTLEFATEASALLTADYQVSKHLSVGGWWNPQNTSVRGSKRIPITLAQGTAIVSADYISRQSADLYDLHAIYNPQLEGFRGLSFQAGFSGAHTNSATALVFSFTSPSGQSISQGVRGEESFSNRSFNLWLNGASRVASPRFRGKPRPVTLFGSFGYYTSSQFNNATNLITGLSVDLAPSLALSGSVWLNDLSRINKRVTVGLSGKF